MKRWIENSPSVAWALAGLEARVLAQTSAPARTACDVRFTTTGRWAAGGAGSRSRMFSGFRPEDMILVRD